jgi:hypothetical protein
MAIVGGLAAVAILAGSDDKQAVVYVRNDIAEGAVLGERDLGTMKVAIGRRCAAAGADRDGCLDVIVADTPDAWVGRVASVPLRRGTLLAGSQLAAEGAPRPDEVVTAIPVARDRMPTGIEVGVRVRVIDTGGGRGGDGPDPSVLIDAARVFAVQELERLSDTVVVSIIVPASKAPAVASSVASDRIGLVLLTSR